MKTKISHGLKKYIRRMKARIRQAEKNETEQKEKIKALYEKLSLKQNKTFK